MGLFINRKQNKWNSTSKNKLGRPLLHTVLSECKAMISPEIRDNAASTSHAWSWILSRYRFITFATMAYFSSSLLHGYLRVAHTDGRGRACVARGGHKWCSSHKIHTIFTTEIQFMFHFCAEYTDFVQAPLNSLVWSSGTRKIKWKSQFDLNIWWVASAQCILISLKFYYVNQNRWVAFFSLSLWVLWWHRMSWVENQLSMNREAAIHRWRIHHIIYCEWNWP